MGMRNVQLVSTSIPLPDGTYAGMWSAYKIAIIGHPGVSLTTEVGVKSLDGQPVTVAVGGGIATVTEK